MYCAKKRPPKKSVVFFLLSAILLLIHAVELLYIYSMLHLLAFSPAGFDEVLTSAELFENAGALVFAFEFFKSALNVLGFKGTDKFAVYLDYGYGKSEEIIVTINVK